MRRAAAADLPRVAQMRRLLWPDEDGAELDGELPAMLGRDDYAVFVAQEGAGRLVGFAEAGVRSVAEGCAGPAGYLEGIWVDADARRRGVARTLLAAAEGWAQGLGLADFASDALLDNEASHAWHAAAGFAEVERLVVFRKRIG